MPLKNPPSSHSNRSWSVYILLCENGFLYTGISVDVKRRFQQHCAGRGARFTRCFGVERLLWVEPHHDRRSAMRREAEIKQWSRKKKLRLVEFSSLK